MSASSLQQNSAMELSNCATPAFADSTLLSTFVGKVSGEIDPDEPPASADLHDLVDIDVRLQFGIQPTIALSPRPLAWRSYRSFPVIKPPSPL